MTTSAVEKAALLPLATWAFEDTVLQTSDIVGSRFDLGKRK